MAEHRDSLRARGVLQKATDLIVLGGYADYDPGQRRDNKIIGRSRSLDVLESAVAAVAFTDGERMDWMTPGSPILVFLDGREVLANVRCLLPSFLRCEALWEGDVPVLDESAVPELLRLIAVDPVAERVADGQSLPEVARFVRQSFASSPGSTYRVPRDAGIPYVAAKEAVDQTLSEAEARTTEALRAEAIAAADNLNYE